MRGKTLLATLQSLTGNTESRLPAKGGCVVHCMLQSCLGAQVGRAKKCLDFAATLYLLHLAAVSVLSAFPRSFAWWAP